MKESITLMMLVMIVRLGVHEHMGFFVVVRIAFLLQSGDSIYERDAAKHVVFGFARHCRLKTVAWQGFVMCGACLARTLLLMNSATFLCKQLFASLLIDPFGCQLCCCIKTHTF